MSRPLYLVAELTVRDRAALLDYGQRVQPLMEAYGGSIVAVSQQPEVLEGDWSPDVLVVHRWRDREGFDAFWRSQEYEPLRALRHRACDSRIAVLPGAG